MGFFLEEFQGERIWDMYAGVGGKCGHLWGRLENIPHKACATKGEPTAGLASRCVLY